MPEIPEDMSCDIKELFNNAGEMIGSWDINMPDIDIEGALGAPLDAGGDVGDAVGNAAGNINMDGVGDGATGAVEGARDAAGDLLEVPGAAAEGAISYFSPAQLKESA